MGNCIKVVKNNNIKNNKNIENYNENSALLPNIENLKKISNKEICAICEKRSKILIEIKDKRFPNLSNMVYCVKCKTNLGY